MMMLLTSTGFDNLNIKNKFLELLNKDASSIKVLFIITAANDPDAVRILSGCLDDLTNCGIKDNNITIYDMHKLISNINNYDAIYVCGGSTDYLVDRINELNFKDVLSNYNGIYVGVSAGSVAISRIGLISNALDVHCTNGTSNGIVNDNKDIYLTDNQGLYIDDNKKIIME